MRQNGRLFDAFLERVWRTTDSFDTFSDRAWRATDSFDKFSDRARKATDLFDTFSDGAAYLFYAILERAWTRQNHVMCSWTTD